MSAFKAITLGIRYGRLTIIADEYQPFKKRTLLCQCDCGTVKSIRMDSLKKGSILSCGCLMKETVSKRCFKHGYTINRTRAYSTWYMMRLRCRDPKSDSYPRYGGRGITVCDRWNVFLNFLADMGEPPDGKQLDRIDNNKGYSFENCRWATSGENARNKNNNRWVILNGERKCLTDWARHFGINQITVQGRLKNGWEVERALSTPVKSRD